MRSCLDPGRHAPLITARPSVHWVARRHAYAHSSPTRPQRACLGDGRPHPGQDLLIVGPGVLGQYLGKLWLDLHGPGTVTGLTQTTAHHTRCCLMPGCLHLPHGGFALSCWWQGWDAPACTPVPSAPGAEGLAPPPTAHARADARSRWGPFPPGTSAPIHADTRRPVRRHTGCNGWASGPGR